MNVYDQAHGLAKAIKESQEFIQYDALKKQIDANPQLAQMVKDVQTKQFELQAKQMMGEQPDAETMAQVQQLAAIMMRDPLAMQYMQAQMRFSIMMNDVYKIIGDAVGMGELAGMRKAEAETIKLYISKQTDRFRPAYGRRLQEFPRQCVFIGTTNESQFLRDTTGNRRFWVVDTPNDPERSLWDDLTDDVIRQIWAEAVELYRKGEKLYLTRQLEKLAREVQESYEEENPRAGLIAEYLDRLLPEDWEDKDLYARRQWLESPAQGTIQRTTVCTLEIWAEALNGNPDKLDRYAGKEIRDIMAGMTDWRHRGAKTRTLKPYGRQRYYERSAKE